MSMKLYVGNLPYAITENELKDLFGQAGEVKSANVIMDKFSGRSKGFGFVEMSSEEEAQKAIETFNGYQMGERTLIVNEARPMEERRPMGGGGDRGGRSNFNRRSNY